MAPSAWKLVVTSLGTQSSALEAEVWADNWLSAVRAGRALLGEDGGIPQGASCAMSETGVVTILDAANRRRYVVQRAESAADASDSAAPVEGVGTAQDAAAAVVDGDTGAASTATSTSPAPSAIEPPSQDASVSIEASASADDSVSTVASAPNDRAIEAVDDAASKKEHDAVAAASRADGAQSEGAREPQASRPAIAAAVPSVDAQAAASSDAQATASSDAQSSAGAASPGDAQPVSREAQSDTGAISPSAAIRERDTAREGDAELLAAMDAASSAEPVEASLAQPSGSAGSAKPARPDAPATSAVTAVAESLSPAARSSAAPARAISSPGTLPPVDSAAIRAAAERAAQSSPAQSAPVPLDDAQRSARAKQTRAYSAQRAESLRREFELSRSLSSFAPPGGPDSDGAFLPRPNLQAVPPVQRALGTAAASGSVPPKAASEAPQPSDDDEHGRTHPEGLVPMSARDVDPSEESPLTYRERAYWAASTDDHARLEALLQAEYIKLRRTLIDSPRGQLIHLAAFDHVFEEQPERPPLATLEWKDWRGTAVFSVTQAGPSSSPRASSTRRRPSSPESSWPVPARSWPGGSQSTSSLPPSSSSWPMPAGSRPPESGGPGARGSGAPARPRPPSREPVPSPSNTSAGTSLDLGWPLAPIAAPAAAAPDSAWPVPSPTPSNRAAPSWPIALGLPAPEPLSWPSAPPSNAVSQPARPELPPQAATTGPAAPVGASEEEEEVVDEWPVLVGGTLTAAEPASLAAPAPKPSAQLPSPSEADAEFELAVLAPIAAPPPPPAIALAPRISSVPVSGVDAQREPTGEVDSRLTSAFEAMPDLYFLPTPIAGLEFTIALIGKLVSCEAVSACLYDINTDEFRFVAMSGPGAQTRRASAVKSQAGLFGCAKRDPDESLVVSHATRDSRFDAQVDGREGLEVRTLAYFPLRLGNQLLGMLQLINRTNERDFSSSDVAVLSYVSTQLAEFLFSRRTLRS